MTAKRPLLCLLLILALACCALLAGAGWLVATESGLRTAARLSTAAVGERLQLSGIRGRLLGPLSIGELRWTTPELQIAADGIELVGWIGSSVDPDFAERDDYVELLRDALPAPCLGVLPHAASPDPRAMAQCLSLPPGF